ncbi:MAG: hypothetical protein KC425_12675, partial [Anaerolineales bacterium]|nr:hypothetical protein [Anaerolineales bacterium]
MSYAHPIASELKLRPGQVEAAIELLDSGNTIPFVARYRKEATGSLDEEQLRQVQALLGKLRALDERRDTILASLTEQAVLTPELRQKLLAADTLTELEDLYQPYRPRRRTRASIARERGLEPLARLILRQEAGDETAASLATPFLSDDVPTPADALAGARDIVAEGISDHPQIRQRVRAKALQYGVLQAEKIKDAVDARAVYQLYYDFALRVDRLRPHQVLAINRGEAEKVLRVRVAIEEKDWLLGIRSVVRPDRHSPLAEQLQLA